METDCIILFGPRACGKSTVGKTLSEMLPRWHFVDIDYEYRLRYKPVFTRINGSSQEQDYYEGCRGILLEHLQENLIVIALNGGSLTNNVDPKSASANLASCRRRGKLVLLLPSRFDFINRRVLLKRESEREYHLPDDHVKRTYNARIKFERQYADLAIYGGAPVNIAKRIVRTYELE